MGKSVNTINGDLFGGTGSNEAGEDRSIANVARRMIVEALDRKKKGKKK